MISLKILVCKDDQYHLLEEFSGQINKALISGEPNAVPWQDGKDLHDSARKINITTLETTARRKWNQILHYIVGSEQVPAPTQHVKDLLVSMGLLRPMTNAFAWPEITHKGYHFMLKDIHDQLWTFVKHYMRQVESPESVIQMLFKLSFCFPGMTCSSSTLDSTQRKLLFDMSNFGLVYIDGELSKVFYPTSLGVNLVFGKSSKEKIINATIVLDLAGEKKGDTAKKLKQDQNTQVQQTDSDGSIYIITETNFKLYSYTSSALYAQMIKFFSEPECVLPNLVVSIITRQSIRRAFKLGITADQIIHFLTENIHPVCTKRNRPIPDNVTDQIILWEQERNRIKHEPGVLYENFSENENALFHNCLEHAKRNKWLMFAIDDPPMLVVNEQYKDDMKVYIRMQKSQ